MMCIEWREFGIDDFEFLFVFWSWEGMTVEGIRWDCIDTCVVLIRDLHHIHDCFLLLQ
jgi:hypothetical protein